MQKMQFAHDVNPQIIACLNHILSVANLISHAIPAERAGNMVRQVGYTKN